MTPAEFIKKWKPVALTERAAAHTHFLDLCTLFEHPDPVSADPTGDWFTFEKGATKTGGGEGFADVWKKNFFAWEYKKKKRDLNAAMDQLVRYAAALENPPLQVVCDTDRFIIRTAWTNAVPKQYEVELDDLALPEKREILWAVFHDPEKLRPKETRAGVTKEAADKFSTIATRLQGRGAPEDVAHFVNQLVFCFFANGVKLLPEGFFPKLLQRAGQRPDKSQEYFNSLFEAMEEGGEFDLTDIAHFNGGLFDGRRAIPLGDGDITLLVEAGKLDWSLIDPTIFGTLFERFLDPDKRAQIGAHYTDPEKIMMIVEPVILRPLRAEWEALKAQVIPLAEKASGIIPRSQSPGDRRAADTASRKLRSEAMQLRDTFLHRLVNIRILDPACGSGNFLYLALQGVKDLENRVVLECEALELSPRALEVGPEILHGIEINPFAAELARTTIWIGDIQWRRRNGIYSEPPPILRKLDAIECRDALITEPADGSLIEAEWPLAEFIVGNPPFLGSKFFRKGRPAGKKKPATKGLGDVYTEKLQDVFGRTVPGSADLCVYWFSKCAAALKAGTAAFGLVATKAIAKGSSNAVLKRIVESTHSRIFDAWTNEEWVIDGAEVRVALICVLHEPHNTIANELNGRTVAEINSDLTDGLNFVAARSLKENAKIAFQGVKLNGPFEVDDLVATRMIAQPTNVNGEKNSRVLKRFIENDDVTERAGLSWVVDFSGYKSRELAAQFEAPFELLTTKVLPYRNKLATSAATETSKLDSYWLMQRPRPKLRDAIRGLSRCILVPETSEHRIFIWGSTTAVFSGSLFVIAREDDTTFGILCSKYHDAWSTAQGNRLGVGNQRRYNVTRTFETFPFPRGLTPNLPSQSYENDPRAKEITKTAKKLNDLRNAWLNPVELVKIEPEVVPGYPDRILPKDANAAAALKTRTLTNLYNQRPQWLRDAHRDLDAAVASAYGWSADISEADAMADLMEINLAQTAINSEGAVEIEDDDSLDED